PNRRSPTVLISRITSMNRDLLGWSGAPRPPGPLIRLRTAFHDLESQLAEAVASAVARAVGNTVRRLLGNPPSGEPPWPGATTDRLSAWDDSDLLFDPSDEMPDEEEDLEGDSAPRPFPRSTSAPPSTIHR